MGDFGMIPIFIEHALYCIAYSLFADFFMINREYLRINLHFQPLLSLEKKS
jgi:hypothetical protein